ncbi:hypothetical protein DFH28DRAFT_926192 [Melampsora americana]|nr:hypothetical protein DFH28DRAFT_926192 [Melampsora americana]
MCGKHNRKALFMNKFLSTLFQKVHADRGGQEFKNKITALGEWLRHANELRKATGKGNENVAVQFKVFKEELAEFKWNKRRVRKDVEEGGFIRVNKMSLTQDKPSQSLTQSSVPYAWEDTPGPPHQVEDNLPESQELAPPSDSQVTQSSKLSQPGHPL